MHMHNPAIRHIPIFHVGCLLLDSISRMGNQSEVRVAPLLKALVCVLIFGQSVINGQDIEPLVDVTYIKDGVAKGAVCLDGSPGAYYFDQGFEDGIDNWIIYLPGGAWCYSEDNCLTRSTYNNTGTTKYANPTSLSTFLSQDRTINPDFYNWNRVLIRYCYGASFMADVEAVDPVTKLYRRGRRIFTSVVEELITKGMSNAANALLIGESAGGLATILNCDRFHSFLPPMHFRFRLFHTRVRKDLPRATDYAVGYLTEVVKYNELAKYLPESCTQRLAPELCFFPENVVNDIETPLFLLNPIFDTYQISSLLVPNHPMDIGWNCTKNFASLANCTADQLQIIMDFQTMFLKTLEGLDVNPSRGLYITSCYIHTIIHSHNNWQGPPTLQNKTVQQAIGDWYFERNNVQFIDQHLHPIDCDSTT